MTYSDGDIDIDYLTLLHDKGKRSRRRELEAVRESGHLLKWYAAQDLHLNYVSTRETGLFRQFMRAYRHSCHAACCACDAYVKRHERRRDRHRVRVELSRA